MGASKSLPRPPEEGLPFFSMTFSGKGIRDTLMLHYCRSNELGMIFEALKETWPPGIKHHQPNLQYGYSIKLQGSPFEENIGGTSETVWARNFLADAFLRLGRTGWVPLMSSDLRRMGDTSTVFVEHKPELAKIFEGAERVAVVGLHESTKLQILNLDGETVKLLFDVVRKSWHKSVSIEDKKTQQKNNFESIEYQEITFDGGPWGLVPDEREASNGRLAVMRIIEALASLGWRLILNCNIRPTTDTLFFVKDPFMTTREFGAGAAMFGMGRTPDDENWQHLVVDAISNAIKSNWHQGLACSEQKEDFYCFEIKGTPWWADGTSAVYARLLFAKVLESLMKIGWRVNSTVDCSRKDNDKNACFFQRCHPVEAKVIVLSFNESDKIRAINCPQDVVEAVHQEIEGFWEICRVQPFGAAHEWKLKGNPWDLGHWHNKALAIHLLNLLHRKGYALLCSADTSAKFARNQYGVDYPLDVHSWFFVTKEERARLTTPDGGAANAVAPNPHLTIEAPPAYTYQPPSPNASPASSRPSTPTAESDSAPPPDPYRVPQSLYPSLQ